MLARSIHPKIGEGVWIFTCATVSTLLLMHQPGEATNRLCATETARKETARKRVAVPQEALCDTVQLLQKRVRAKAWLEA
jgi:hypothetical protein